MLVLTRKPDEKIMIGDDIEIVVVAVEGDRVRLGIKAPKGVSIYRGEVYEAIQQENREASQSTGGLEELLKAVKEED